MEKWRKTGHRVERDIIEMRVCMFQPRKWATRFLYKLRGQNKYPTKIDNIGNISMLTFIIVTNGDGEVEKVSK